MVEVTVVLRGVTIEIDDVEDMRERAALQVIRSSIRSRVGDLVCPEHGAGPRVTASGQRPDSLEFDLSACCDSMIQMTARCFE